MGNLKIEQRLIDEAVRIREEYLKSLVELKTKEENIVSIKDDLNNAYNMVSDYVNDIDKEMIENKIARLTKDIKEMQTYIQPIVDNVSKLGKDANILFEQIKDKNPRATKKELVETLSPHLKKIDDKFNIF